MAPGCEVTPFVFKDRFYRIENFKRAEDLPGTPLTEMFHEDGFRIRDIEKDCVISVPLLNHYFATAFVWQEKVYIFCGDYEWDRPWWHIRKIQMICSSDLITWSKPKTVVEAEKAESMFNISICHNGDKFIMLYETDDKRWPKFTFKFCESDNLTDWHLIKDALYGTDKYVGGPAMYFVDGYYYVTYVNFVGKNSLDNNCYDTRIARSKDLFNWEDASCNKPFIEFDSSRKTAPEHYPDAWEINASDAEMHEWQGKTIVYFNGGDQMTCGDLQVAEYPGKMKDLVEAFFG